jgi:arabinofuranosyltransferase
MLHDPVSMIALTAGFLGGLWWRTPVALALMLGMLSSIGYVTWIGADYMGGRFYGPMVMISVLLCAHVLDHASVSARQRAMLGGLLAASLLAYQYVSPASTFRDAERSWLADAIRYGGVVKGKDHRLEDGKSLFTYLSSPNRSAFPVSPEPRPRLGPMSAAATDYAVQAAIGVVGYSAGVRKIIIDPLSIADPVLARLPPSGVWRAGHFYRCLPPGYEETRVTGTNQIRDPGLYEYYERVRPIYQGDSLLAWSRLTAIVELNTGGLDGYLRAYSPPKPECDDLEWLVDKTRKTSQQPPDGGAYR